MQVFLIRETQPDIWRAVDFPQASEDCRIWIWWTRDLPPTPGHGQGSCLFDLEDETGIANAFVPTPVYERNRLVVTQDSSSESGVACKKKNNNQGVINIYSEHIKAPPCNEELGNRSYDFL